MGAGSGLRHRDRMVPMIACCARSVTSMAARSRCFRYLRGQVEDLGLPEFVNRPTPVAEVAWSSSASRPTQFITQYLFGVGLNYTAQTYAVSAEMLIPGSHLGVIAQFHLYLRLPRARALPPLGRAPQSRSSRPSAKAWNRCSAP